MLRKNWLWGNLLEKNLVARVGVVMLGRRELYVKRESVCVGTIPILKHLWPLGKTRLNQTSP